MARRNASPRWLAVTRLAVGAALVAAACGGAASNLASSVPSVVATPVVTPTAAPTPSPTPADVSAAFTRIVTSPTFSAVGTIDGSMTIGAIAGKISGDGLFDGGDSSGTTKIEAGTLKQVTQSVTVGSDSWSRKEPGPWLADEPNSTSGNSFDDYLRSATTLVDLGVETYKGQQLHHLQPKTGNKVQPAILGFDVGTAKDAVFTVDLYATDDGTPAIMHVTGDWTTVSGSVSVPTSMDFDLVLSDVGKAQTITPPTDVWTVYTSKALGYSMAHPADWTVTAEKGQDVYKLNGQGYVYVAPTPYKGSTTKFATDLKASYKKPFKGDPASETPTTLGGVPAVRLIYHFTNSSNQDVTVVDDVVSRDGTGWEVYLATGGGQEDIDIFDQFVSTFTFTE